MPLVEQYWIGVLQRLQAEVDVFARLVSHAGEMGRENELALARILDNLIPRRLGVGTGLVFDACDHYSKQMDVVLYEQADEPLLMAQTSQLLFPVEVVAHCIEVKTMVRSADVKDVGKKAQSLDNLHPVSGFSSPPLALLGYRSNMSPSALRAALGKLDRPPDLVCILEPGLIGGRALDKVLPGSGDGFALGSVLLQDSSSPVSYVEDPGSNETHAFHNGRLYPRTEHAEIGYLGDPARALLLFVDLLLQTSAGRMGRPAPILSKYLSTTSRGVEWLDEA